MFVTYSGKKFRPQLGPAIACEQKTHFRSSLLSLPMTFRRERGDDRKCVCCSQAILYLKHPRGGATTLSIILHFSTGRICYQYPNKNSSVPIKTSCSFPENLCFKFDKKTEDNEQVTVQGCITAEQCRQLDDEHLQCCEGDLCNNSKCHGYRNAKIY